MKECIFVVYLYMIGSCMAAFLGGTISSMQVQGNKVEFTYRLSWEKFTGPCGAGCSNNSVGKTGSVSDPQLSGLHWTLQSSGRNRTVCDVNYVVTSVSIRNVSGWEQGEYYFMVSPPANRFIVSLSDLPWILSGNSTTQHIGYMETFVDVRRRNDTNRANRSPYVSLPSFIGVPYNCKTIVALPVEDPDRDRIRCRWAMHSECGGACTNVPDKVFVLDRTSCNITVSAYNGTGYTPDTYYRLTVIVEDYPGYTIRIGREVFTRQKRISSVPLQITLYVTSALRPCDSHVTFVQPTAKHMTSQPYGIMVSLTRKPVRVPFFLKSDSLNTTEFMPSFPMHMTYDVEPDVITRNRSDVMLLYTGWVPERPLQQGNHQVCVWGVDEYGVTTDARCVTSIVFDVNNCGGVACMNGGHCVNIFDIKEEKCECTAGYKGKDCTQVMYCQDSPCENNGTCTNTARGYRCVCPAHYYGRNCQYRKNQCGSSSCHNNGTCVDLITTYRCICSSNYHGNRCQYPTDMCKTSPCRNNGTCVQIKSSYRCICPVQYTGNNCDKQMKQCSSSPCRNQGICVDISTTYRCTCSKLFTGHDCEIRVDPCSSSPCRNQGTCVDMVTSYHCVCLHMYTGHDCEHSGLLQSNQTSIGTANEDHNGLDAGKEMLWVVLVCGITVVLLTLLLVTVCMYVKHSAKRTEKIDLHRRTGTVSPGPNTKQNGLDF